jgi:hypothetical protein
MADRTDDDTEVISRPALLARGMSDTQIRRARDRGELVSLLPGLYLRADPGLQPDPATRHRATLTVVIPYLAGEPVVSHVSAAIVHGLPFCHSEVPPLHVTRPDAAKSRRGAAVRLHKASLEPVEVVDLGGLAVTSAVRTVVDCALSMPFDHAVVLADAALRRGLVTRQSLQDQLARLRRVPGSRQAAAALAFADPRSRGPGESFSRVLLHRRGFPVPELDVPLSDRDGRPLDPAAFAFPDARVLGDFVDRPRDHRVGPDDREMTLRETGWRLVRWSWPDLRAPEPWAERLRSELAGVPQEVR